MNDFRTPATPDKKIQQGLDAIDTATWHIAGKAGGDIIRLFSGSLKDAIDILNADPLDEYEPFLLTGIDNITHGEGRMRCRGIRSMLHLRKDHISFVFVFEDRIMVLRDTKKTLNMTSHTNVAP